jgi:hypothetical protein
MFGCTALLLYIVRLVSQAIDKKCFQHKMCVKIHKQNENQENNVTLRLRQENKQNMFHHQKG